MALYAIGDLHLCLGAPKPMDIFGGAWTGYRDKLVESLSVLQPEDVLVLAGDFSWGMSLQEALPEVKVQIQEDLGYDSDAKEAVAFALLANEALFGICNNAPSATGASHGVVMGRINL